jgi:hypothetical protein
LRKSEVAKLNDKLHQVHDSIGDRQHAQQELSEQLEGLTIEPHLGVGDLLKYGQIRPYQISARAHFRSLFADLAGRIGAG